MNKCMSTMLIIALVLVFGVNGEPIPAAVNELTGNALSEGEREILSNRLRSELIKTGVFKVMERGEMDAILKEQGFQQSGACDESSCIVEVGRLLGVQKIVAGNVGKMGTDFYSISLRVIDVGTGEISKSADYDYRGELSGLLTTGIAKSVAILSGKSTASGTQEWRQISITSVPEGAKVYLGTQTGYTPFTVRQLPGVYRLSLHQRGFVDIDDKVTVSGRDDAPIALTYTLKQRRKGYRARIISAIIGGGAAAAGLIFNARLEDQNDAAARLQSHATGTWENTSTAEGLKTSYDLAVERGEKAKVYRTIAYGTATVSASLFGISFAFGGSK